MTSCGVRRAAAEILATEPDVVGFTSTFMQNVPSLATARRLDADDGSIIIDDRRHGWPRRDHRLTGWHATAYRILTRGHSAYALRHRLREKDQAVEPATVDVPARVPMSVLTGVTP